METKAQKQLFDAIKSGDVAAVQDIIEREPSLINKPYTENAENHHPKPLLYYADWCAESGAAIVEFLLSKGADPNVALPHRESLLMDFAWRWCNGLGVEAGVYEICARVASGGGSPKIIRFVEQVGGLESYKRRKEQERSNCRKVFELLVKYGADVNVGVVGGCTPLHRAAWNARIDLAEMLLQAGADRSIRNAKGQTPLDFAKDRLKRVQGSNWSPPPEIAQLCNPEQMVQLLSQQQSDNVNVE